MPVARDVRVRKGSVVSFNPGRAKEAPKRSHTTATTPVPNSPPASHSDSAK
jgi:hypothetical protein